MRHTGRYAGLLASGLLTACAALTSASDALAEFNVKREEVFAFEQAPSITREGDRIAIAFETKGLCDVTVAVEDAAGKIVRHFASGVLGEHAPPPFEKGSRKQRLVWDGKDDQGKYLDDKDRLTIRVSLGLKPQFERNLYFSPYKRVSALCPIIQAAEDGVYVYDGRVVDSVRVYDREGRYARTAYPFAQSNVETFKDLHWHRAPQDGANLPLKEGFHASTLLTSGETQGFDERRGHSVDEHNNHHGHVMGNAASTMAVRDGLVALAKLRVNYFRTDGSALGGALNGPAAAISTKSEGYRHGKESFGVTPYSAAFSPGGKWLYLAGYRCRLYGYWDCMDVVMRVNLESGRAEPFLGAAAFGAGSKQEGAFRGAASVAVDAMGRVYVADFANDRVQVFSPDGKFLKAVATPKPAVVRVHAKSGELYVFSWLVHCRHYARELPGDSKGKKPVPLQPALRKYGAFDDPRLVVTCALPLPEFDGTHYKEWTSLMPGPIYWAEVDSWSEPPTIWLGRQNTEAVGYTGGHLTSGAAWTDKAWQEVESLWDKLQIKIFEEKGGKLELKRDFGRLAKESVGRTWPQKGLRQRLFVNPADGLLYVGECDAANKAFKALLKIDPENGHVLESVGLPFDAEDAAFDMDGHLYLRSDRVIVRYDPQTFREVPWDYGDELKSVGFSSSRDGERTAVISGLVTTFSRNWHHSGLWVAPNGNVVAGGYSHNEVELRRDETSAAPGGGKAYVPPLYPGRAWGGSATVIHIWDKRGKVLHKDALPGLMQVHGLALDQHDDLYVLASAPRFLGGERYFNKSTGTLLKCAPSRAKIVSASEQGAPLVLSPEAAPKRPPDLGILGKAWAEGVEWLYGGVGFSGDSAQGASHCSCHNMRFGFDYFARSFVPETDHYSVAVLDSNGNLVCRIGRYGNVDDGRPLVPDPAVPQARAIGGDEVALFHACYLGTHSDRRLFVADAGNGRVLSVKLGYHTEAKIGLNEVADQASNR